MAINWPTDLQKLMKRISTPAEEVYEGLDLLGDYVKELGNTRETALNAYLKAMLMARGKDTKVYFVDAGGSNDADGLTPATAFATITHALGECDDDYSADALYYVFVAPGTYAEAEITAWGKGIHLIGLGLPGRDSGVRLVAPDDSTERCVLAFAGGNCELANMCIESLNAKPPFEAPALDNSWIHDCVFHGDGDNTVECMLLSSTKSSIIERNKLFGFQTAGINHIAGVDHYLIESTIRNNEFGRGSVGTGLGSGAKGIFVHVDTRVYGTVIDRNHINLAEVAGEPKGIDINSTTGQILITDNYVVMPSGKVPIECAMSPTGILGNHTMAGTTVVDPDSVAAA